MVKKPLHNARCIKGGIDMGDRLIGYRISNQLCRCHRVSRDHHMKRIVTFGKSMCEGQGGIGFADRDRMQPNDIFICR